MIGRLSIVIGSPGEVRHEIICAGEVVTLAENETVLLVEQPSVAYAPDVVERDEREVKALEHLAARAMTRNQLHAESIDLQRQHLELMRESKERHEELGQKIIADIAAPPVLSRNHSALRAIHGIVVDAGGGELTIRVDRGTDMYPGVGVSIVLVAAHG